MKAIRSRVVILVIVATGLAATTAAKEPERAPWAEVLEADDVDSLRFTHAVARALREELPEAEVRVADRLALDVVQESGTPARVHLDNLYRDLSATPAEREAQIRQFVSGIASPVLTRETLGPEHRTRLRPVIRDAAFVAELRRRAPGEDALLADPLVADLWVLYVLDLARTIQYVTAADLEPLALPREALRATALAGLRAGLPSVRIQGGPVFLIVADGTYDSSVLLLDEVWTRIEAQLGGPVVAAVPTRSLVAFAAAGDVEAVEQLRALAREGEREGAYPVSRTLLLRQRGRWQALEPDPAAP